MKLIIANANYSSWSLRAWMLMRYYQLKFDIQRIDLSAVDYKQQLLAQSPAGYAPVLLDGDLKVWDSLAICEYINEQYLKGVALPESAALRAQVRSRVAEMHSGFSALRSALPMNIRARRTVALSEQVQSEIARIETIWSEKLQEGEWLAGNFGILDAFFAPIASRFETYGIRLNPTASAYQQRLLSCDAMQEWTQMALAETEIVGVDEAGTSTP